MSRTLPYAVPTLLLAATTIPAHAFGAQRTMASRAAVPQLPDATALDGELVVWEQDRLAFKRLQNRLHRLALRPPGPPESGLRTSSRSACSGCLEPTPPAGPIGAAAPHSSPCSPPGG
ncbi:hypothetical protein ACFVTC_34210 [Streptomyces sp. NPDC057950]|uniref:hypothetical protein n=1 Tax=Streptomyces sp. NPDC057950 TaxID=3346288 RepID=UPI0036EEB408